MLICIPVIVAIYFQNSFEGSSPVVRILNDSISRVPKTTRLTTLRSSMVRKPYIPTQSAIRPAEQIMYSGILCAMFSLSISGNNQDAINFMDFGKEFLHIAVVPGIIGNGLFSQNEEYIQGVSK